ncbi:putative hydrolase or acyltransferase of alpha/beta superfamily [Rivularia sp. PCC 7116]|uniref:alpha/beta fold hydrolase n=1 Tax=Rivularia sp. PCC 7116 TaxID=373994 RepID=UPI00029ED618|nr:alpha/beta hydrolase [Rivularia sp. PCC 7116]AFY56516.1 putative hydrolase or acyltransferase of alpha/beta superfamily [Rivularia sp. PCC 7116]
MKNWWQDTFPQGKQTITITDSQGYPVKIAYGEKGKGKPLFLLHGIGSWSYNWRNLIEPLSKYFRVICFDAKGFGFSEKPLHREETTGHQVIELQRIITALCNEPVAILSESLGALVALAFAQEYSELVSHLAVVNVPIFTKKLPHWGMSLLAKTPLEIIEVIDKLRLSYLFAPLIREIMAIERRSVLFDPSILTQENVFWITYPYIEFPGTFLKVAQELQIAAREIENAQKNQPNWLSKIQNNLINIECPTLIMWGEQDTWFPIEHGKQLHQLIPSSLFQVLPECHHDASSGASDAIEIATVDFLRKTNFLQL